MIVPKDGKLHHETRGRKVITLFANLRSVFVPPITPTAPKFLRHNWALAVGTKFMPILMEIARNQGMDPMAIGMKAYAAQAEKVYEDRLEARIAAVESPIIEMQNASVEQTADREMFLWAQSVRDENGQPAFPELQKGSLNEDLVVNVYRAWKQLAREFGPQYAYSAPGFDYAYRLAYDLTPRQDQGGPSQGQDPGRPRDDQGRFLPAQSAASAASDITGNQPNPSRSRAPKSSMQEMLEELTAIQPVKIGTTDLGFYE